MFVSMNVQENLEKTRNVIYIKYFDVSYSRHDMYDKDWTKKEKKVNYHTDPRNRYSHIFRDEIGIKKLDDIFIKYQIVNKTVRVNYLKKIQRKYKE